MKITDEMVEKACTTYSNGDPNDELSRRGIREALEAAAPLIRAQGMREAAKEVEWNCTIEVVDVILARAEELEKAAP